MAFMGEIRIVPYATAPKGWSVCDGRLLPIMENMPLFSLLELNYGGDGKTEFALPNLTGRVLLGTGAEYRLGMTEEKAEAPATTQPRLGSLALNIIIATEGIYPGAGSRDSDEPLPGEIRMFGGDFAPVGWRFCDGQTLSAAEHPRLFDLLQNTFGGDGKTNFKLPDLSGRTPVGSGPGHALGATDEIAISTEKSSKPRDSQRSLAVSYIIHVGGEDFPADGAFIGEIRAFAINTAIDGWIGCHGGRVLVGHFTKMFSIISDHFGRESGDDFFFPDLGGRVAIGRNAARRVGSTSGSAADGSRTGQPFVAVNFRIANVGSLPGRA